ncbi:MAG: FKBP-type peptidyl-prolyl cis-trans isomerase [Paludibacteraceae bacterium]|nr:FKBP-type peptidyl-prolyl cis-trans isomerase [Paludibacteraceae bacterium]
MKVENQKVVTLQYDLYVDGENGQEEIMEQATADAPLVYCHGEGMMLPAFEHNMAGLAEGEAFDFRIACADAYGEYDTDGVIQLDKKMFYNGDGEFDSERVYVGAIVPMNTADGQVINAQIAEITKVHVTIDLNHPLAGENLHFIGKVLNIRDVTEGELKALHHRGCGGCGGHCGGGDCGSDCGGNCSEGGCGCGC